MSAAAPLRIAAAVDSLDHASEVLHRLPFTPEVRELHRRSQALRTALEGLLVERLPLLSAGKRSRLVANVVAFEREVEGVRLRHGR